MAVVLKCGTVLTIKNIYGHIAIMKAMMSVNATVMRIAPAPRRALGCC
jgi:hypothetical protein